MRTNRIALAFLVAISNLLAVTRSNATLIPMPDGKTVFDTYLNVRWLTNANLAGTDEGKAIAASSGVANITPGGSMNFDTAMQWLKTLNGGYGLNGGAGYLGHTNWTLPTTPLTTDFTCGQPIGPNGNSFGFGCKASDLGSLFNITLNIPFPNTAVPIPDNTSGLFHNFQPYLYWTKTENSDSKKGYQTFSFNTGWAGSNVDNHYMYVLPMLQGNPFGTVANDDRLQLSSDGQTVYDPKLDITWLADADLAQSEVFTVGTCVDKGIPCINQDGSMSHTTAVAFKDAMNAYNNQTGWLGQTNWELPPDPNECGDSFSCTDTPLGRLFFSKDALGLEQGNPVVPTPDVNVGPFNHLQPYLYWSCSGPYTDPPCQNDPPASGFEWSFSFGNGFQGTDVKKNDLYVMVYFPQAPAQALADAINMALGSNPESNAFLAQASNIYSAPDANAKAGRLAAFINHVNAQRDKALTPTQADELIALAQAI
jgi:hypothetical protein